VDRCLAGDQSWSNWEPTKAGSHGTSKLIDTLQYLDYNFAFPVPVAHAALLGVVKNLWSEILQKGKRGNVPPRWSMPSRVRQVLAARQAQMVMTCDFGRPYSCVVNKRGSWVMEDWVNWLDAFSPFVLQDIAGQVGVVSTPFASQCTVD
jgi:hypothetical protein